MKIISAKTREQMERSGWTLRSEMPGAKLAKEDAESYYAAGCDFVAITPNSECADSFFVWTKTAKILGAFEISQ